ncbi:hypothetical protein H257_07889 [Aphanomyces astaci]|uniref:Endonuclease/exonuclease/phosphatase domain-containing protein n=1 Tax=Aphanomyces astaci TaxID=112090 RepID=W4GGX7_APHAT|nr:hypothetical protein H257_07889 [Aphanomyces astaci]ETV78304.1 hypothetical protein H257_07889 [Aphanomyces astaci]|eukprot:XP_009831885.1 hypothetical protein H257_07889 [Aphanomyces astaci]
MPYTSPPNTPPRHRYCTQTAPPPPLLANPAPPPPPARHAHGPHPTGQRPPQGNPRGFRANALDFPIIADSDLPAHKATQFGTPTIRDPNTRGSTHTQPYSHQQPPGLYPAAHKADTNSEWLTQAATRDTGPHHVMVMGGDFNRCDRSSPTPRSGPNNDIGIAFQQWSQRMGLVTTFRHRHPNFERYTYARNNTTVALDDIYISARTAHKMGASGIWLHTIHSSDNAGTPYMAIDLFPGDHTPYRLTGVQPIRAVTRNLAKVEINSFGAHTSKLLLEGQLPQLTPAPPTKAATTWSPQEIVDWLDEAVRNLYDILYTSAKLKWGETSQTRKALNRAVEIQRNNQCTAHLRQLFRLHEANLHTGTEFTRLAHLVEWPKWIRNPNVLPPRAGTALEPLLLANGGLQCLPNRTLPTTGTSGPDMDSHAGPTSVANVGTVELPAYAKHECNNVRHGLKADKSGNSSARHSVLPHRPSLYRASLSVPTMAPANAPPAPDTGLEANRQQVPQLVRDWLLHDVDRPDEVTHAFQTPEGTTWDTYHYDEDIQARCERSLRTRVSPEHGGVHMNSGSVPRHAYAIGNG